MLVKNFYIILFLYYVFAEQDDKNESDDDKKESDDGEYVRFFLYFFQILHNLIIFNFCLF